MAFQYNPFTGVFDKDTSGIQTEVVPFSVTVINTWQQVPHNVIGVFNVETFDNLNQNKILIQNRILPDNTIEVRSNKLITTTLRIQGES